MGWTWKSANLFTKSTQPALLRWTPAVNIYLQMTPALQVASRSKFFPWAIWWPYVIHFANCSISLRRPHVWASAGNNFAYTIKFKFLNNEELRKISPEKEQIISYFSVVLVLKHTTFSWDLNTVAVHTSASMSVFRPTEHERFPSQFYRKLQFSLQRIIKDVKPKIFAMLTVEMLKFC